MPRIMTVHEFSNVRKDDIRKALMSDICISFGDVDDNFQLLSDFHVEALVSHISREQTEELYYLLLLCLRKGSLHAKFLALTHGGMVKADSTFASLLGRAAEELSVSGQHAALGFAVQSLVLPAERTETN